MIIQVKKVLIQDYINYCIDDIVVLIVKDDCVRIEEFKFIVKYL